MAIGTAAAIAIAASAASSAYAAHKQSQAAGNAADMQKNLMDRQSGLASTMERLGQGQISTAKPALDAAMRYYMTLGTGNRGQINSLLAPQVAQMTDTYRGAERGMEARMAPGPQRDAAEADLARQKSGALGIMPMAARNSAMGTLADLGGSIANRGMQAYGNASSALTGASNGIGQYASLKGDQINAWQQFGGQMGNILIPYLLGKGGGSSAPQPGSYPSNPWGMIGKY